MTPITRSALAVGAAVLLASSLGACGEPPTDASKEEYCDVVNDPEYAEGLDEDSDEQDYVDAVQLIAGDLRDVGTPEDIPDDAREGFEIQLDAVDDLEADDLDLDGGGNPLWEGLSADELEKVEAYTDYESETCPDYIDIGPLEDADTP